MATEYKLIYLDRHTGEPLHPAWLRGYKQASEYAGLKDRRHRKLKKWMQEGLVHVWDDGVPLFKPEWIDQYLMRNGLKNLHPITEELLAK